MWLRARGARKDVRGRLLAGIRHEISVATEVGKNSHEYISVWRVAYASLPTRQFINREVKNLPSRQAEVGNLFGSDAVVGIFAYSYGNTDFRPPRLAVTQGIDSLHGKNDILN